MISLTLTAALAAAPAAETTAKVPPPVITVEVPAKPKGKAPDFGTVLKMMDKFFPAQPEPEPARLALSRVSVQGLLPDGAYGQALGDMFEKVADRVLDMSGDDLGIKGKDGKKPSSETLRQKARKDDPHFDERMAIIKRIAAEEMSRLSTIIEPRMREGLARSMARRFDEKQLGDLNAFLATESGKAYGRQSMAMWVDPDMLRSMMTAMPDLFMAVPGIAARIDKETAHLPKPKKPKPAEEAKSPKKD